MLETDRRTELSARLIFISVGLLIIETACVSYQQDKMDISSMPKCRITSYDRSSEISLGNNNSPKFRYIRSRLITEQIAISKYEHGKGLSIFSSTIRGLNKGDIIKSIFDKEIKSYASYFDFLELNVNRTIDFGVIQNGKVIHLQIFDAPCKYFSNWKIEKALFNELYSGKPVNLLVLEPKVIFFFPAAKQSTKSVVKRIANTDPMLATALYGLVGFDNFKILRDRNIDIFLKELELKQLGLIEEGTAVKVGKLTGANYVAETTFRFFGSSKGLEKMEVIKRVFNLELGTVDGVDSIILEK